MGDERRGEKRWRGERRREKRRKERRVMGDREMGNETHPHAYRQTNKEAEEERKKHR